MRIQHFNDYGKIVLEEGFDNYLHDSGPLFHDTVTNTTTYLYTRDTLLIKKASVFRAMGDSSLTNYAYDSRGRLTWDYEVRARGNTGLTIGGPIISTGIDTISHIYHYGNNGKLSFVEMPDNSPFLFKRYYEYNVDNNLIAIKEWVNDSLMFALTSYEYDADKNLTAIKKWEDGRRRIGGKAIDLFGPSQLETVINFEGGRCITVERFDYYEDDKNQTWFYNCIGNTTAVETEISQWGQADETWFNYGYVRRYYDLKPMKRLTKEERSNFYGEEATIIYEYR